MSPLDDVVRDLRDKRLWPVAGLLAVALPAIPLIPHHEAPAAGAVPALAAAHVAAAAPAAAATAAAIAYEPAPTHPQRRASGLHDPFAHSGGAAGGASGASSGGEHIDLGDGSTLSATAAGADESTSGGASSSRSGSSAGSGAGSSARSMPSTFHAALPALAATAADASTSTTADPDPATPADAATTTVPAPASTATTPAATTPASAATVATTETPPAGAATTPVTAASGTTTVDVPAPEASTTTPDTATTPPATTAPATTTAAATPDVAPEATRIRIGLRFRVVGVAAATRSTPDATRLLALPTPQAPAAVLLGAAAEGRKAVFLVSDQATAWGEGSCTLAVAGCPGLELGVGETELLDLPARDGALRRYALTVTAVDRVDAGSPTAAARLRAHRSKAGAHLVRQAIAAGSPALDRYRWSAARGRVLEHRPTTPAG